MSPWVLACLLPAALHQSPQALPSAQPRTTVGTVVAESCPPGRIHVFMINGLDPLFLGGMHELCDLVRASGFSNTECHRFSQSFGLTQQILAIRETEPSARFAVIGFSGGSHRARTIVNQLGDRGVEVNLLAYIGGDFICNTPKSRPWNARHVLNVTARGFLFSGGDLFRNTEQIDGAVNCHLDVMHLQAPRDPRMRSLLIDQLNMSFSSPVEGFRAP